MDVSDVLSGYNSYYGDDFEDELDYNSYNIYNKPLNTSNNSNLVKFPLELPKNKKSKKINTYSVYNEVIKNVIGQDEQVKNVISILVRNNMTNNRHFKSNMFLIGGTGNGKSETIKQIAKNLDMPYVIEDAAKYTQEGYVGESVENALAKLIDAAGGDIKKAERGIVVFDEIDKKTDNGDRSNVATTSVQDGLLKMLEGAIIYTSKGAINTELITFVLIGACENTFEERKKRLSGKGVIGFNISKDKSINNELNNPKFIPEDLVKSGFKSELVGRIDAIIEFNPMDELMAKKIINNSKISIFNLFLENLNNLKIKVIMDSDKVVSEIIKRAIQLGTGARGIRQVVVEMFENIYSTIFVNKENFSGYECIITEELVYDNTKFKLCKKKQQN